jgi:hypothetical protein
MRLKCNKYFLFTYKRLKKNKMQNMRLSLLFLGLALVLMYQSCSTCSKQNPEGYVDLVDFAIDSSYYRMAQSVVFALPTPIEMSMLIKSSGVSWQPSLVNNPDNAAKYLTTQKMALNFGIYLTNLAYAGLFDQPQMMLKYKEAIALLAEGLGLQMVVNASTIEEMEANINDRSMLLSMIAEIYSSSMAFFDESERYHLTLTSIVGGWIEGMYIATSSINENLYTHESRVRRLVVDMILTFEMIWHVMSEIENNSGVSDLMTELSGLIQILDRISIDQSANVVTKNAVNGLSEISSFNIVDVSAEDFENMRIQIQIIRENFTNI